MATPDCQPVGSGYFLPSCQRPGDRRILNKMLHAKRNTGRKFCWFSGLPNLTRQNGETELSRNWEIQVFQYYISNLITLKKRIISCNMTERHDRETTLLTRIDEPCDVVKGVICCVVCRVSIRLNTEKKSIRKELLDWLRFSLLLTSLHKHSHKWKTSWVTA